MTSTEKYMAYIEALYERTEFTGDGNDGIKESELQSDVGNYANIMGRDWCFVVSLPIPHYFHNTYTLEGVDRAEPVFLLKPKYNHKIFTFISPSPTYYKFKFNDKIFDVHKGEEFFYNALIRKEAIDEMLNDLENNND